MNEIKVLKPANLKEQITNKVIPKTMSTALEINNARRTEKKQWRTKKTNH